MWKRMFTILKNNTQFLLLKMENFLEAEDECRYIIFLAWSWKPSHSE
jgi:hypothetical protein